MHYSWLARNSVSLGEQGATALFRMLLLFFFSIRIARVAIVHYAFKFLNYSLLDG